MHGIDQLRIAQISGPLRPLHELLQQPFAVPLPYPGNVFEQKEWWTQRLQEAEKLERQTIPAIFSAIATLDGKAVPMHLTVTIQFRLQ